MKKLFSDERIISILRKATAGVSACELCRKHVSADATFYTLRKKFGGMEVPEVISVFQAFRSRVFWTASRSCGAIRRQ